MKKRIYMFRIEVKRLPGSKMPKDAVGAFVNCVVPGKDRYEAEALLKLALKEDKYQLVRIDKIEDFDALIFDEIDEQYIQMAKDALKFNEVYYGDFNIWYEERHKVKKKELKRKG